MRSHRRLVHVEVAESTSILAWSSVQNKVWFQLETILHYQVMAHILAELEE